MWNKHCVGEIETTFPGSLELQSGNWRRSPETPSGPGRVRSS